MSMLLDVLGKALFNEIVSALSAAKVGQPILGGALTVLSVDQHGETLQAKVGKELYKVTIEHTNPDHAKGSTV